MQNKRLKRATRWHVLRLVLSDCALLQQNASNLQVVFKMVLCLKCINEYVISLVYFHTHRFYIISFRLLFLFLLRTTRATSCCSCSKRFYCISVNIDSFLFSTLLHFYGQRYLVVVNGDWVVSKLQSKWNSQRIKLFYKLLVAYVVNKYFICWWR